MNLLLFEHHEVTQDSKLVVSGRRATHLRKVLKVAPGKVLRVGMLGGMIGEGVVEEVGQDSVRLHVEVHESPPAAINVRVVLALPRPRVFRRVLASLVSFGVKEIAVVGANRTEKSYWHSPILNPESIHSICLEGLEQSRDTLLPSIHWSKRFRPFVEDTAPVFSKGTRKLLCHPGETSGCPSNIQGSVTVAMGPDGGWVPFEVDCFVAQGFEPVSLGPQILRVETAVNAVVGRLALWES
jgi:RsmE family RNA methyltransferase